MYFALGAAFTALLPALAGVQNARASDDVPASPGGVSFSGSVESVNRVLFDGGSVDANRNTIDIRCAGGEEKYRFLAEVELDLPGFSEFAQISDLESKSSVEPVDLSVQEAYLDLYGFPFGAMDMRIGKQIVVWGEAGLFIPEGYTRTTLAEPGSVLVDSEVVDEPFVRYVLDCDYTFRSGLYANLQFVHGFDFENEKERLGDYLTMRIEKNLFHDKFTFIPLTSVTGTEQWEDFEDHYGVAFGSELQYFPYDNVEIDVGFFLIGGKGDTFIARLRDYDSLYLIAKASF
jgi:hypothetical protein